MAAEIKRLWDHHTVLLFRGQKLTEEQQMAFTANFGELAFGPEDQHKSKRNPAILRVANVDEAGGKLDPNHHVQRYFAILTQLWHTDGSYKTVPSYASCLHALEVPDEGGETCFAGMIAAYEQMPPDLRRAVDGQHMVHFYGFTRVLADNLPPLTLDDLKRLPPVTHPLVRTHADGRKSLYISDNVGYYIGGVPHEEGKRLHRELIEWATQPRFVYAHSWQVGDVVMWDNRTTMHSVRPYDHNKRRVLQRTELVGTEIPA